MTWLHHWKTSDCIITATAVTVHWQTSALRQQTAGIHTHLRNAPLWCYTTGFHAAWSALNCGLQAPERLAADCPAPWTRPGGRLKGDCKREAMLDHWSWRGFQAWQDNYLRAFGCPASSGDCRGRDPYCPSCWSISACRCGLLPNQEIGCNQSLLLISAKATLWLGFMIMLSWSAA